MNIRLNSKNQKFSCEVYCNGDRYSTHAVSLEHSFSINSLPAEFKIYITPYKVQPYVRIDNFLVNYGLAEITPWDHMLEFTVHPDWQDRYFKNIIKAKQEYLSNSGQSVPENMDKYVGINNLHPEMLKKIEDIIS